MAKLKILFVDDEESMRKVMDIRIKSWGYNMIEASGGRQAIGFLKTQKPDLIILDYMMPEMDGVATLKKIRKINSRIPVIMFTAYPDEEVIEGTEKLGVSAFIPKLSIYSDADAALKEAIYLVEKKMQKEKGGL
jgi:CheY-like chemotaxis protein